MFSGGLDSTAVFYKLIQDKTPLYVHHINFFNAENRMKAESVAVKKICEYMNKIGNFKYSESYHELPSYNDNFMWDSDLYNFMAGSICGSVPNITHVALGMTKSDLNSSVNERATRGTKIFECFNTKAKKVYPIVDMTKKQVFNYLPKDLRSLTWSCRTPIYQENRILECEECKTCRELNRIKKKITS
jgi:7-cyano-7-deazaguanine synthase in queuosine biosynthesis